MTSSLLEACYQTLIGNAALMTLVESKIYKNKSLEESGALLKSTQKTIISCEIVQIDGTKNSTEPAFIVDVRSKKTFEYCAEVVQAVKELLDDGISYSGTVVAVSRIDAPILESKELVGWRSRMRVYGTINTALTITSLTPNVVSPQVAAQDITFVCIAADVNLEEVQYKFLINGPGTGSKDRDMTGWIPRNSFIWKTKTEDIGTSSIKVQVRDSKHKGPGSYDATSSIAYTISAPGGGGSNPPPTITSLTPNIASPQEEGADITFVCIAADADGDEILYKFWLNGPGTGSKLQAVTSWQKGNSWVWKTSKEDVGASTVYVQVRDGFNAGAGSYDAQTSVAFTIASSLPTITSLTPALASPQAEGKEIAWVCVAGDTESDELFYKFWLNGPRTGSVWQDMTGWIPRNSWLWKTGTEDTGANQVKVQVLDMKHASKGSYDAESSPVSFTIANATPTISTLTTYPASPQVPTRDIKIICVAADAEGHELLYRFWVTGPGSDSQYIDLTGWQAKNWTTWTPKYTDSGSNTIKVQIIDQKHALKGGYDAESTLAFTVSP